MQEEAMRKAIEKNWEEVEKAAAVTNIDVDKLAQMLEAFGAGVMAAAEVICEAFRELAELGARVYEALKNKEVERERRQLFKTDFSRPKIRHQVACRKPRFAVRKIIH